MPVALPPPVPFVPAAIPEPHAIPPRSGAYSLPAAHSRPVTALPRDSSTTGTWLRAARVRQWAKNLLVFGAPAAAGALGRPGVLVHVWIAFGVFCLLATGAYLINDIRDRAEDRLHPAKRHRPIASGAIGTRRALITAVVAVVGGIAASLVVSLGLAAVACGYVLLNIGYSTVLRSIVVVDIAVIAGAFVLRASAGAIAAGVPISRSFIVVVSCAALFVAAGKRYTDYLDPAARRSRRVLERYSERSLQLVISTALVAALGAYCLWAFEAGNTGAPTWREMTIIPFAAALLRYTLLISRGVAGAPERILFTDRVVQVLAAAWLVMFALGI